MARAAPRPCTKPGCTQLVHDGSGRCAKHPREAWRQARTPTKRITGRRLQAMRAALFMRQPLCEVCDGLGIVTLATIRDHRIPLAEGGADDESNEQAICAPCHEEKSLAEALRGRRRPR
ncbi:restriction endonuclease [Rhodoferax koreense]|uniref:Restriction endonuclease n=2 Tax=Rhodoferax koreensis TaxID=1842727 RepID=A0A1P8JZ56_9BURK|nr:restriction endonuclease [Rhodoferax koreense]